ncbi:hypothetical protein PIB30_072417 [Stylosanthes scabra]|uniref:Uncharacterized protein n=1 Tax=Stylosanthes scabra TaxID=79078 RepID=A0ABU6URC5_9FABA|nr:hypothetical protein [Stylosanthes scabra]
MQYPREEDAKGCMRVDVIEELIKEVQEEDAMLKSQAKQASDLKGISPTICMHKILLEEDYKASCTATKKTKSNHEGSSAEGSDEIVGCWCHIPNFRQLMG